MAHSSMTTSTTTDRKDTRTMNDHDLHLYLVNNDMRDLDSFAPAAREIREGDIVSISYEFNGDVYIALRRTVEKGVYPTDPDTFLTSVYTTPEHGTVSIFYHVAEEDVPEPGVLLRSIVLHHPEDLDDMAVPAGAPCPIHPDGCQAEADEKVDDLLAELLSMIASVVTSTEDDEPEGDEAKPDPVKERLDLLKSIPVGSIISARYNGTEYRGEYLVPGDNYRDAIIDVSNDTDRDVLYLLDLSVDHIRVLFRAVQDEEPKALSPDEFQAKAMETAVFPGQGTFWGLQYATSGLANEAGEVLGVIKKMQRDKGYTPNGRSIRLDDRVVLKGELGDVAWYLAVAAHEAAIPLSEVFSYVLAKLADRRERGVLGGSGDNR